MSLDAAGAQEATGLFAGIFLFQFPNQLLDIERRPEACIQLTNSYIYLRSKFFKSGNLVDELKADSLLGLLRQERHLFQCQGEGAGHDPIHSK